MRTLYPFIITLLLITNLSAQTTVEDFDNAVGNFFPDPPVLNENFWTNGPTAFLNFTNNTDKIEGVGSTLLEYRVEGADDWGGYVVRSTYSSTSVDAMPYIDLSTGTQLSLWYKIVTPSILSHPGTVFFEFKIAEYNDLGQRDLWIHHTSLDLLDNTEDWINFTMPLIQSEDSFLGFAPQFIDGDGILQLDKVKGFEITVIYDLENVETGTPIANGSLLLDNLQLVTTDYIVLSKPNGGELWKAGIENPIRWTTSLTGTVDLEYSIDNGLNWDPVASGVEASLGEFWWVVPNEPSTECKVKITELGGSGLSDESEDLFEIKSGGVVLETSDPNNTADGAQVLAYGDVVEGGITPDTDVDYYKFYAEEGDTVEINGEERNTSNLDGLIQLFREGQVTFPL